MGSVWVVRVSYVRFNTFRHWCLVDQTGGKMKELGGRRECLTEPDRPDDLTQLKSATHTDAESLGLDLVTTRGRIAGGTFLALPAIRHQRF